MDNRKLYITLAATALVILVAFAIAGRWPGSAPVAEPGTPAEPGMPAASSTPAVLQMEVVTRASTTDLYAIHVEYPRFPAAPALTAEIDAYMDDAIRSFVATVSENDRARRETQPDGSRFAGAVNYSLGISWDAAQLNSRSVSFLARVDAFEGGANLRQEAKAFNWDLQANRAVTLAELFPDDPSYLQRISEYARGVLATKLGAELADFVEDGTQPTLANFSWFTFTDDAVTFTFPKYQVAPGAAGEQEVMMPRGVSGLW